MGFEVNPSPGERLLNSLAVATECLLPPQQTLGPVYLVHECKECRQTDVAGPLGYSFVFEFLWTLVKGGLDYMLRRGLFLLLGDVCECFCGDESLEYVLDYIHAHEARVLGDHEYKLVIRNEGSKGHNDLGILGGRLDLVDDHICEFDDCPSERELLAIE